MNQSNNFSLNLMANLNDDTARGRNMIVPSISLNLGASPAPYQQPSKGKSISIKGIKSPKSQSRFTNSPMTRGVLSL
jgi:hypothetical protein